MNISDYIAIGFLAIGTIFFVAGALGLLRFPDTYSRLHALSKADNLGLGFILTGIAIEAGSLKLIVKLGFVWLLLVIASATSCYLVANTFYRMQRKRDLNQ